jgi:hypothetical protein
MMVPDWQITVHDMTKWKRCGWEDQNSIRVVASMKKMNVSVPRCVNFLMLQLERGVLILLEMACWYCLTAIPAGSFCVWGLFGGKAWTFSRLLYLLHLKGSFRQMLFTSKLCTSLACQPNKVKEETHYLIIAFATVKHFTQIPFLMHFTTK